MAKFHNQKLVSIVNSITNVGYIVGCSCLYFIAIWIFGAAIWNIIDELFSDNFSIYRLLDEVAFIVFSIAVIDVCK